MYFLNTVSQQRVPLLEDKPPKYQIQNPFLMHQSIPAVPIPPRANPRALAFFKKIGRIPRGGDEKRGQMPRPQDRRLPIATLLQFLLTSE